jgi:hypothetical protein
MDAKARRSTQVSLDVLRNYVKLGVSEGYSKHVVSRYRLLQKLSLRNEVTQPDDHEQVLQHIEHLVKLEASLAQPGASVSAAERADVEAFLQLSQVTEFVANDRKLLGTGARAARTTLLDLMEVEKCPTGPTDFHRAVAFLMSEGLVSEVLTTNYDCLFETACNKYAIKNKVVHNDKTYDMSYPPRIVKLHGSSGHCSDDPENIMVTASDVCRWHHRWAEAVLEDHLRQGSVVLFVGFSGRDLNVIGTLNEIAETLPPVERDRFFLVSYRRLSFVWYQFMAKAHGTFEDNPARYVLEGKPGNEASAESIAGTLYGTLLRAWMLDRLGALAQDTSQYAAQLVGIQAQVAPGPGPGPGGTDLIESVLVEGVRRRFDVTAGGAPSVPLRSPLHDVIGTLLDTGGKQPGYKPCARFEPELQGYAWALSILGFSIRRLDAVPQVTHSGRGFPLLELRKPDGGLRSYLVVPVQNRAMDRIAVTLQATNALQEIEHAGQTAQRILVLCTGQVDNETGLERQLRGCSSCDVVVAHPGRLWGEPECLF